MFFVRTWNLMGSSSVNMGLLERVIGDWLQGSFQMFVENTPLYSEYNETYLSIPEERLDVWSTL